MRLEKYHIAALISKYLQQTLTAEENALFQEWLSQSDENRQLLNSFRDGRQINPELAIIHGIDVDQAWNTFHKRNKRTSIRRHNLLRLTGYAAMLVISFLLLLNYTPDFSTTNGIVPDLTNTYANDVLPGGNKAYLILSNGSTVDLESNINRVNEQDGTTILGENGEIVYDGDSAPTAALLYNTLRVPKSGQYNITLADGTKIWVNAQSELSYPVKFGNGERRVSIKGEAYFEVVHDADRPFVIEVNGTTVEVLGTAFNVNAYSEKVVTTLVEGAVKVGDGKAFHRLLPGQQSYFDGSNFDIRHADIMKATSWKNDEFYFKADNITEVMGELSRWYDLQIEYTGKTPLNKGYSGNISRKVKLTEVLEMLTYVSDASFEIQGKKVKVIFKE